MEKVEQHWRECDRVVQDFTHLDSEEPSVQADSILRTADERRAAAIPMPNGKPPAERARTLQTEKGGDVLERPRRGWQAVSAFHRVADRRRFDSLKRFAEGDD